MDLNFIFLCYVTLHSQGHITMGSLWVEEPVHTSWSRFCTVDHWASPSNHQFPNMKCPGRDSNRHPQRLKASTLTASPPSPPPRLHGRCDQGLKDVTKWLCLRRKGFSNCSSIMTEKLRRYVCEINKL